MNEFDNNIGGIVNSEPNIPNKKGNNVVLIIVLIFIAVGMGIGGFVLGTKLDKGNDETKAETPSANVTDETTDDEKETVSKPEKNARYTFIKEQSTEVEYSGSKHSIVIYYYSDKEVSDFAGEEIIFNALRRDVFVDGKYVIDAEVYYLLDENVDVNTKIPSVDSYSFKILKDSSNSDEYLLVEGQEDDWSGIKGDFNKYVVVVDKNGSVLDKLMSKIAYTDVYGVLVNDSMLGDRNYTLYDNEGAFNNADGKYVIYKDSLLDIHDKFIYILSYDGYINGSDQCREYKYFINNGLSDKTEINVYSGNRISVAGQS